MRRGPTPRLRLLALLVPVGFLIGGDCTQEPHIFVSAPFQGAFVSGPSVTVQGSLAPAGRTGLLFVNGAMVPVAPGGAFSTQVPVSTAQVLNPILLDFVATNGDRVRRRLTVVASDGVTSTALPVGQLSPESLLIRLNDSGLDQLEPLIASQVPLDVTDLIPLNQVIFDECFIDIFGCTAGARVSVKSPPPSFSGFSVNFDSQPGSVATTLVVNDLRADFHIDGIGIVPNCDVRITSSAVIVTSAYDLRRNVADPSSIDVVQVGNANVDATGFHEEFTSGICDDDFIGDIIQSLLPDVEGLMEDGLRDYLNDTDAEGNTPIAAALEDAFASLDLTGPLGEAVGVTLDAEIHDVAEDADGITMVEDTAFIGDTCDPPQGTPTFTHTWAPAASAPTYGALTPAGDPYDLGLGVSGAGLNQLFRSQIECGLLTIDLDELPDPVGVVTGSVLAGLIPEVAQYPLDTLYEFRIRPTVAPVVTNEAPPGGGLAEVRIGGLFVEVRDVAGVLPPIVDIVIDARLGLDLSLGAGVLNFELLPPGAGDIQLSVVRNDIGTNEAQLVNTLQGLFSFLLPFLGDTIEGLPLPEFLGLQLQGVDVARTGDHFTFFLDLAPAPAP